MAHKRLIITSLFLALSGSVVGVQAQTCTPTAVKPYIKVAGVWTQTATASVNAGNQIVLGPQPTSGGSWLWSGDCGTSGTTREQTFTPGASCTATTVYTNSCGAKTSQDFTIKVPLYPSYNTNPIAANATGMSSNAVQLAAKIKLGTNIGNVMEAYGCTPAAETCWGQPKVSAAYVKLVKDSGFDAIRIPVSWDQYADQKTGKISDVWLNRVKQVVQYAVDNGLYVIVNIHWDGGWLEKNFSEDKKEAVNAKQKAYWEQIATQLRDFDEHVLFASANEPDADDPAEIAVLESYHQTFVNAVRSTGGRNAYRVLVVQAPQTNIDLAANLWNVMPTDTVAGRQMAEVHFYPFSWSIQTQDEWYASMFYYWGKDFHSTTDTTRNATREEEDFVNAEFAKMKAKFADHGIPVVLGEYAATLRTQLTGDNLALHRASRAYYSQYVAQTALANGMLPFYWEVGVDPGLLFDRTTPAVGDPQILDSLLAGAGKGVVLSARPNSWTVSSGAANTSSGSNMRFTLNQAGAAAGYTLANPVNLNGATLKVVLNFDQAFVSARNGGMDAILQFYAYSANWAASEFKCWTANQTLVADQDTEFTCSAFGIQNAVGVGIQFPKTAGSVTIKRAAVKFAQ
ncbi:cellulase family glycosylhydrolase [Duganella sp.]|uniref:cellulase family glycosylhydrolase n=1 Tax=Duganella sp. TaxID=1904440 RepID=UPI0031DFB34E